MRLLILIILVTVNCFGEDMLSLIPNRKDNDGRSFQFIQELKTNGKEKKFIVGSLKSREDEFYKHLIYDTELWLLDLSSPQNSKKIKSFENSRLIKFERDERTGNIFIFMYSGVKPKKYSDKSYNDVYVINRDNINSEEFSPVLITDHKHNSKVRKFKILSNETVAFTQGCGSILDKSELSCFYIFDIKKAELKLHSEGVGSFIHFQENEFIVQKKKSDENFLYWLFHKINVKTNDIVDISKTIDGRHYKHELLLSIGESKFLLKRKHYISKGGVRYEYDAIYEIDLKKQSKTLIHENKDDYEHVSKFQKISEKEILFLSARRTPTSRFEMNLNFYNIIDKSIGKVFVFYKAWDYSLYKNEMAYVSASGKYGSEGVGVIYDIKKDIKVVLDECRVVGEFSYLNQSFTIVTVLPWSKKDRIEALYKIDNQSGDKTIIAEGANFGFYEGLFEKYVLYSKSKTENDNQEIWLIDIEQEKEFVILDKEGNLKSYEKFAGQVFFGTSKDQLLSISDYFPKVEQEFLNRISDYVCELGNSNSSLDNKQTEAVSCRLTTDFAVLLMINNFESDIVQEEIVPSLIYSTNKLKSQFKIKSLSDIELTKTQFHVFKVAFESLSLNNKKEKEINRVLFLFETANDYSKKSFLALARELEVYDSYFMSIASNSDTKPLGIVLNTFLENWKSL